MPKMPKPYDVAKFPAPRGQKSAYDKADVPAAYALALMGLQPSRHGVARAWLGYNLAFNDPNVEHGSIFYYKGKTPADDRILLTTEGRLGAADIHSIPFNFQGAVGPTDYVELNLGARTTLAGVLPQVPVVTYTTEAAYFGAQFDDELIIVGRTANGTQPKRFYIDGTGTPKCFRCGIAKPATPTAGAVAGGVLTGTYSYLLVYKDERGRRSEVSNPLTVTLSAQQQTVSYTWGADFTPTGQVSTVEIYRTVIGVPGTFFLLTTNNNTGITTFVDNTPDASIITARIADPAGYNAAPSNASCVAVWNRRLVLNKVDSSDANAASTLQISNQESATQFSPAPDTGNALSGTDLILGDISGDQMMGFFPVGGYLVTLKQSSIHIVQGDNPLTFTSRRLHSKGAVSIGAICNIPNGGAFLSNDGVYAVRFDGSFDLIKLSDDIDDYFYSFSYQGVTLTNQQILAQATLFYVNNRLYLSVFDQRATSGDPVMPGKTWVLDMVGMQPGFGGLTGAGVETGAGWADFNFGYARSVANINVAGWPDAVAMTAYNTSLSLNIMQLSEGTPLISDLQTAPNNGGWRYTLPPVIGRNGVRVMPLRLVMFGKSVYGGTYTGTITVYDEYGNGEAYIVTARTPGDLEQMYGPGAALVQEFNPTLFGNLIYIDVRMTSPTDFDLRETHVHWAAV